MEAVADSTVVADLVDLQASKKRARSCRSPNGKDRKRMKVDTDKVEFTVSPEKNEPEEDASFCAALAASQDATQEAPMEPPSVNNIVPDGPMVPVPDNVTEEMSCTEKESTPDNTTEEMPCVEKNPADESALPADTEEANSDTAPTEEMAAFVAPEKKQPAGTTTEEAPTEPQTQEMPSIEPQNSAEDEETQSEDEDKTVAQEVDAQKAECEPQTPLAEKAVNALNVTGHLKPLNLIDENSVCSVHSCATTLETPQQPQGKENELTQSRFDATNGDSQPIVIKPLQFNSQASQDGCYGEPDDSGDSSQVELTSQEQPEQSRFGCSIM